MYASHLISVVSRLEVVRVSLRVVVCEVHRGDMVMQPGRDDKQGRVRSGKLRVFHSYPA